MSRNTYWRGLTREREGHQLIDLAVGLVGAGVLIGVATSTGSVVLRVIAWVAVAMTIGCTIMRVAGAAGRKTKNRPRGPSD